MKLPNPDIIHLAIGYKVMISFSKVQYWIHKGIKDLTQGGPVTPYSVVELSRQCRR